MSIRELEMVAFWLAASILAYVYFGYPLLVRVLAAVAGRPVQSNSRNYMPVTIVITAYNEEECILSKIANLRNLEFAKELLEIIVVSDGSTDSTDALVKSLGLDTVRLLRVEGRVGKTACQNAAVAQARGQIVVFTDATTQLDREALSRMVANFADDRVGCVAGLLVYQAKGTNLTAAGARAYWNYEIGVRQAESRLGTLIGVSGCLYAVRRSAYRSIDPRLISDFVIAMRMREQGLRTVLEPRAVCFEETLDHSKHELVMRVRVGVRSLAALVEERRFLNIFRDPLFAWQLWSHKVLRYASPYWILLLVASSVALVDSLFYRLVLVTELALVLAGITGFVLQTKTHRVSIFSKPYYFLLTNVASAIATLRYAAGERMVTWKPIR